MGSEMCIRDRYLQRHLGNIGIVVERDQGTNDDSLVGFRKIEKRE